MIRGWVVMQVSADELNQVKVAMDTVFEQTVVKPGDVAYVYNLQRNFAPVAEGENDWDDVDDAESVDSGCSDIPWDQIMEATKVLTVT